MAPIKISAVRLMAERGVLMGCVKKTSIAPIKNDDKTGLNISLKLSTTPVF